jgi:hypothetical protein
MPANMDQTYGALLIGGTYWNSLSYELVVSPNRSDVRHIVSAIYLRGI